MKRFASGLILVSAILIIAGGAHAATCQLGVKGGVAIQKVADDSDSRTGFAGGGFFQADFSENFGLRFEGLYFMKGATGGDDDFGVTLKLDYIEFPVLGVAHVPVSETGRLDFFAGPTFGININSELEISTPLGDSTFDLSAADFEFGLAFGAGFNFDVGSVILGIDGRYELGITQVDEESDDDGGKNQGFAFMASLGFPLGDSE